MSGNAIVGDRNTADGDFSGNLVGGNDNRAEGTASGNLVSGNNNQASGTLAGNGVTGNDNIAVGTGAGNNITASRTTSIGAGANASQDDAIAIGTTSQASGVQSIAVGDNAAAAGDSSNAVGVNSTATGQNSAAYGANTTATNDGSVAIGTDSNGNGAQTTWDNQMVFGTANHTYTMPGITSSLSRARQSGPLEVVTTDANGNLASDQGATFEQIAENKQGIAMAIAMENPDLVGMESFGVAANWGHFDGANAIGISAMGVLSRDVFMDGTGTRLSVSGSFGYSPDDEQLFGQEADESFAGRAGLQLTW